MKLIVREHVNAIAEPVKKVINITIDAVNNFGKIPASIGLTKGDLSVFRGEGDPVRLAAGSIAGRILVTDPDAEGGWSVQPNSSGSGSSATLHNATGVLVKGGSVVKIQSDFDFIKATSSDTTMLFVTAEDCGADEDVVCYSVANTICSVLCTSAAVAANDQLAVSSTDGVAEATSGNGFAVALSSKASGSVGLVDAMIVQNGFLPLSGGTLTGNLELANALLKAISNNIDEDVTPESQKYYSPYQVLDKDGNLISLIGFEQTTTGKIFVEFAIRRKIGGTWTYKYPLQMGVDASGNFTYIFGDPAAARTALGVSDIGIRPNYQISTTDLTAGTSTLESGKLYFVYS